MAATILLTACSTNKNTSATRFYHSFAARFNILYNGQQAYQAAQETQRRGHQDDYTQLLPMTIAQNKTTAALGKSQYETAITKSEKAIKLHSIKKRPTHKAGTKWSAKEKNFSQRKEFNPYLRHAWILMGKSQYHMGAFIEAASTFSYIQRLYSTQPEVSSVATAWLARCYVAMGWPYDAETLLDKTKRDSMSNEGRNERQGAMAAYLISTKQYAQAMPYLRQTIRHTGERLQRARLNFLAGQLESQLGNAQAAYKHFQKVIRSNPPYEMAFNARIQQSEVMSGGSKAKSMIKKLQRMASSDKNKDYLDQLYYAIGNIYLSQHDTTHCIYAYEQGTKESTRNGAAKAQLLLRLSQIYWEKENYIDAARTYAHCINMLEKEHPQYKQSELRSKALAQVAPHLSTIKLQDSLQRLAVMPENKRLEAIDRVIQALKKQEKEEAKKQARANVQTASPTTNIGAKNMGTGIGRAQKGAWYFYNPTAIQRGKQEFIRKWGKRPNKDLWRWSKHDGMNIGQIDNTTENINRETVHNETQDSIEYISEEERARQDSLANDPHERAYYLTQIPFSEQQRKASNQLISDALYNSGLIIMRDIGNLPYARRLLTRLLDDFPAISEQQRTEALYHLFLLCGHMGDETQAKAYANRLMSEYPQNKRAKLLGNPLYERIAREGKHLEDTTYQEALAAYEKGDYPVVFQKYTFHEKHFPQGPHRARMLFISAMSQLYSGNRKEFLHLLEDLIKTYDKEEIAEIANEFLGGIKKGRLLSNSKYGQSDIWKRRSIEYNTGETLHKDTLKADRYAAHCFVLAYPTGSLDENLLLYEMARYNFTSYMVRNFEIDILSSQGLNMMCVRGFLSYDEVHAYAQRLYADKNMFQSLRGIRSLLISNENLEKIGTSVSIEDYEDFYQKYLGTLSLPKNSLLDEPANTEIIDPDNIEPQQNSEGKTKEQSTEDDFPYGL